MKDLVLLVADKNAKYALQGALLRPKALGIHDIDFEIVVHSGHDGGARTTGAKLLALQHHKFRHGLLIFDFEGCGTTLPNAVSLEAVLDEQLEPQWDGRAKTIVIEPELDVWAWGSDHAIENALEWPPGERIREWLRRKNFTFEHNNKPVRPKESLEAALRELGTPRSSVLYKAIATKISLKQCEDAAFIRLRNQLTTWFPTDTPDRYS